MPLFDFLRETRKTRPSLWPSPSSSRAKLEVSRNSNQPSGDPSGRFLRTTDYKNEELGERTEISIFILFCQDTPFGELFSKTKNEKFHRFFVSVKNQNVKMQVDGRSVPPQKQMKSRNFGKFSCNNEKVSCFAVFTGKNLSFKLHKSLKPIIYF